ncbi:DMT family transporter [Flagellimonas myxillae]|uniref:DMT family transporter n=1 Tax=Flagellimonas myxillae TaxID=2942214 RepID=UPI00201F041A|nr:EamA family transporter [Muricauda myxillae]MCL6268232.1 DMT family transporter [Muricauda myxillae]
MRAILYLIIATTFLGLNFHLARVILKEVSFIEAGFWRFLFGAGTLALIGIRNLPSPKSVYQNLRGVSLPGFIGLFGFNIFFFLGLKYSTAINAALIVSLNPALTLVISRLILKTKIEKIQLLGITVAFLGAIYLIVKGNITDLAHIEFNIGDILIFIANIFFALHHVWVKKFAGNFTSINFTFLTGLCCLVGFTFMLPATGMSNLVDHSTGFWMAVIGIGCFGTALAYFLWQKGVHIVGPDKAGIYMNVVPLSAAVLTFFFNENLYLYHLIGGLLIITGLFISRNRNR